jgi:hypothetical protein
MTTVSPPPVRSKPARSIRLNLPPSRLFPGVVTITAGKHQATYFLTCLDAEFGQGWQLEKIGAKRGEK